MSLYNEKVKKHSCEEPLGSWEVCFVFQGFHGGGGGGVAGYSGGTAEKIVFLSTPLPPLVVNDTKAAVKPAFPAMVGSVYLKLVRASWNLSNLSGPPTMAPVMLWGFGFRLSRHFHPPVHDTLLLPGIDAPR